MLEWWVATQNHSVPAVAFRTPFFAAAMMLLLLSAASGVLLAAAAPTTDPPLLPELHLDPHSVTISGISSGAAMTNQLAVAFSESFAGAAAFAGKPWNCEQVSTPGFVRPTTHGGNTCNKNVSLIVVEKLVEVATAAAAQGAVDDLSNVKRQRNFVMRGQHDSVYVEGAVNKTVDFWRALGAAAVFDGVDLLPSGHGIPTDRCEVPPCVTCAENHSPFLVACNWDGAGHALQWMLGTTLKPRAARTDPHAWSYYDQRPFGGGNSTGLAPRGVVYTPLACRQPGKGAACKLHINLHGCGMAEDELGLTYVQNAGFAEWAETNSMVVLFPQTGGNYSDGSPGGFRWHARCWDNYGFTGLDYAEKTGPMMAPVYSMLRYLTTPLQTPAKSPADSSPELSALKAPPAAAAAAAAASTSAAASLPPPSKQQQSGGTTASPKSVRLWVGSPAGFWGGPTMNLTKQTELLANLSKLADVVDTISIPAFFLGDHSNKTLLKENGGLVPGGSIGVFFDALHAQGHFKVEALIGDFYGQNSIDRYRFYWGEGREAFVAACAAAVKTHNLSGLNFDFEPSAASCNGTEFPPACSSTDDTGFVKLLDDVRAAIASSSRSSTEEEEEEEEGGGGGSDAKAKPTVSVDTGQSAIANTAFLNASTADQLITMNTYGDTVSFKIALPRDLGRCGADRFSLGVCPGCTNGSDDISERIEMATRLGVRHVSWWSQPDLDDVAWWAAVRKWKKAA